MLHITVRMGLINWQQGYPLVNAGMIVLGLMVSDTGNCLIWTCVIRIFV